MKKFTYSIFFLLLAFVFVSACSHIDEDEQLIYVAPAEASRAVLIEDFTGQRCVNCPNATATIAELQASYGDSSVIAVAIHSGDFGKNNRGVPLSLYTETGDEYYNYWRLDHQPVGVINRMGPSEYTDWTGLVREYLQSKAKLTLTVTPEYDAETRNLQIHVLGFGTEGDVVGKLQLWLTEDSITDIQLMPDGAQNRAYVHNHVFRTAVNGTWGTDFRTIVAEYTAEDFMFVLSEAWVPRNMHIVAFVYTENGVEQVVSTPVIP